MTNINYYKNEVIIFLDLFIYSLLKKNFQLKANIKILNSSINKNNYFLIKYINI